MSTQRRENGSTSATKWAPSGHRQGPRNRRQGIRCTDGANGLGQIWLVLIAWFARALARVGTAPPHTAAWLATNSLQSDHLLAQRVRFVEQDIRRGSPPIRKPTRTAGFRSSHPLTPTPSVLVSVLPSCPNNPAGQCRWTERYDGKRDLHFINAA